MTGTSWKDLADKVEAGELEPMHKGICVGYDRENTEGFINVYRIDEIEDFFADFELWLAEGKVGDYLGIDIAMIGEPKEK